MRLENYINQLMFQHDCVIVPKFGAFISHPTSATINPDNHTIIPPHHAVSFNSTLTTSDGILVNAYAEQEQVNIEDASLKIEEEVNNWNDRLQNGESIVLDKIGTLKNDAEGILNFEPLSSEEFLPDAFGLKALQPNIILKDSEEEVLVHSKRNWSSVLAAASIIPIIVGGYFYFNTPHPVQKFVDHQWSGVVLPAIQEAAPNLLNSSSPIEKIERLEDVIHNLPTTISNPLEYVQAGTSVSIPAESSDSTGNNVLSRFEITVVEEKKLSEDEKEVKAIIRNSKVDSKSATASNSTSKDNLKSDDSANSTSSKGNDKKPEDVIRIESNPKKFQVIAASLRRADDAARMLRFLESEGFKNANIIYVKGRYYYVTFDSFDTMEKASKYLNDLHKQRPDAWVREHN